MAISTAELNPITPKTAPHAVLKAESAPEFGFADLLDVINPLQHLPGVGIAYRAATGDDIKAPMRILGGALFGGPIGMIAAAVYSVAEQIIGYDPEKAVLADMGLGEDPRPDAHSASGGTDTAEDGGVSLVASTEGRSEAAAETAPTPAEPIVTSLKLDDLPLNDLFSQTSISIPQRSAETDSALAQLAADMRQGAVLGGGLSLAAPNAAQAMAQANANPASLLRGGEQGRAISGGGNRPAAATQTQSQAALQSVADQSSGSGHIGTPTFLPADATPEAMMRGLQKYEAMLKARQAAAGLNRAA